MAQITVEGGVVACDRCGGPVYDDTAEGCTVGSCSMRPLPPLQIPVNTDPPTTLVATVETLELDSIAAHLSLLADSPHTTTTVNGEQVRAPVEELRRLAERIYRCSSILLDRLKDHEAAKDALGRRNEELEQRLAEESRRRRELERSRPR